ncbi:hypothetical protein EGC56_24015 [Escherichia coli]|nr:hypothetical protein [Escherichia coli]EHV9042791.1 hypothetical protein [Escherichia coli]HEI2552984.1 hypothetical protein [Escherichia coli]HEI2999153.1 hypothetical protein [Escherichia coli]
MKRTVIRINAEDFMAWWNIGPLVFRAVHRYLADEARKEGKKVRLTKGHVTEAEMAWVDEKFQNF